jgi:hypothetical protein
MVYDSKQLIKKFMYVLRTLFPPIFGLIDTLNVKSYFNTVIETISHPTRNNYTLLYNESSGTYMVVVLIVCSWIYNYLCNQYLSPLTLWVRILLIAKGRRGCHRMVVGFTTTNAMQSVPNTTNVTRRKPPTCRKSLTHFII